MLAILDYGAGNLTSVRLAFERLGAPLIVAASAAEAEAADRLVFPGVGSAGSGMREVKARKFDRLLRDFAANGRPVMGMCLGMQLLLDWSAEDGGVDGVGLIPGRVVEFAFPREQHVKVPHMGWNTVTKRREHPVLESIGDGDAFYFVHSFYAEMADRFDAPLEADYAGKFFTAAVAKGSIFATQFHPERSGESGEKLLHNFLAWDGRI